jgi:hypothetical protein
MKVYFAAPGQHDVGFWVVYQRERQRMLISFFDIRFRDKWKVVIRAEKA